MSKNTKFAPLPTSSPPGTAEEPKGFFSQLKGAIRSQSFTSSTTASNDIESSEADMAVSQEGNFFTKYSQKLKHSLSTGAVASVNRSRTMMQSAQESYQTSINLAKNMPYIILLGVGGAFFLFIAFFFIPMIVVAPQKFSFSFALGCMCFMGAIALIREPKAFLMSLLQKDKILFTAGYLISLIGTFYSSMVAKTYLLSLFFAIAQIVSLLWLIGASIPGGKKAIGTVQGLVIGCCKMTAKKLFASTGNVASGSRSFLPV